jgi:hypothetical protein
VIQMPPGVPVAAVGLDNARNAALLAARIIDSAGGWPLSVAGARSPVQPAYAEPRSNSARLIR